MKSLEILYFIVGGAEEAEEQGRRILAVIRLNLIEREVTSQN